MPRAAMSVATSTHVLPFLKLFERALPRVLRLVAVDRFGGDAVAIELLGHAIGAVFRTREHDCARNRRFAQQLRQHLPLVAVLDEHHVLIGQIDGDRLRRHVDADGIAQNFARERGHFVGHRCGEQQRLARFRQGRHDSAHVADEAHVEQSVGFVEHQQRHLVEPRETLTDEIEQAPRRCDQYVDAAAQRAGLRILADAAEDRRDAQVEMLAIRFEVFADLNREFTRRRENQCANGIGTRRRAGLRESLQHRHGKRGGLAGAGLRDAEQVLAGEQLRNRLRLNGSGLLVIDRGQSTAQRLDDAELGKE